MIRRPPRSTRTDTLVPYTTLFRSAALRANQYDIDAWKQNKMLTFNEKWTFDSQPDLYDEMHPAVKSFVARQKKVGSDDSPSYRQKAPPYALPFSSRAIGPPARGRFAIVRVPRP